MANITLDEFGLNARVTALEYAKTNMWGVIITISVVFLCIIAYLVYLKKIEQPKEVDTTIANREKPTIISKTPTGPMQTPTPLPDSQPEFAWVSLNSAEDIPANAVIRVLDLRETSLFFNQFLFGVVTKFTPRENTVMEVIGLTPKYEELEKLKRTEIVPKTERVDILVRV